MIRSLLRIVVVCLCAISFFPVPAAASSAAKAFSEGFHAYSNETHFRSFSVTIDAVKHVDGKWRRSEVHIVYDYHFYDGTRNFDATVVLDGDPDMLEVSRDLGWGGLDAVVYVQWRRMTCTPSPHTCQPEVVETIPVELHIAVFTEGPVAESGGYFTRNALGHPGGVVGTIKTPDHQHTFEGLISGGYTFSDQYPG